MGFRPRDQDLRQKPFRRAQTEKGAPFGISSLYLGCGKIGERRRQRTPQSPPILLLHPIFGKTGELRDSAEVRAPPVIAIVFDPGKLSLPRKNAFHKRAQAGKGRGGKSRPKLSLRRRVSFVEGADVRAKFRPGR